VNRVITEEEFKIFYEQTSTTLLAYLRRVTQDASLADDVFQEAYVRLLQRELRDRNPGAWKSYLFTSATNLLRDHWRRAKKSVRWEDVGTTQTATDVAEDDVVARSSIEKAFARLSPHQRSLLWLAYVEAYSHKEIAEMLNLRQKSVKVLLFRARKEFSGALRSMGIRKEEVL